MKFGNVIRMLLPDTKDSREEDGAIHMCRFAPSEKNIAHRFLICPSCRISEVGGR
jgi:hypothetical protein